MRWACETFWKIVFIIIVVENGALGEIDLRDILECYGSVKVVLRWIKRQQFLQVKFTENFSTIDNLKMQPIRIALLFASFAMEYADKGHALKKWQS